MQFSFSHLIHWFSGFFISNLSFGWPNVTEHTLQVRSLFCLRSYLTDSLVVCRTDFADFVFSAVSSLTFFRNLFCLGASSLWRSLFQKLIFQGQIFEEIIYKYVFFCKQILLLPDEAVEWANSFFGEFLIFSSGIGWCYEKMASFRDLGTTNDSKVRVPLMMYGGRFKHFDIEWLTGTWCYSVDGTTFSSMPGSWLIYNMLLV